MFIPESVSRFPGKKTKKYQKSLFFCKLLQDIIKKSRWLPEVNKVEDYITVDGKRLEMNWYGPSPGEAPTLVFLHHGLGCAAMWRDYPERLAAAVGCGALVYSRWGYGCSDPCSLPRSVRFMHEEGLEVLPELLEVAGIGQCLLIGQSDGASIAIIYAGGTTAKPLLGIITEAPHVFFEKQTMLGIQQAKQAYQGGDFRKKLEKYHGSNTDCAFWGWNDTWLHPDFVEWDIQKYLPGIKVPMLVIQGENDEYGTGAQVRAIESYAGAGADTLILPGCGHAPHQEQETVTFKAMKDFILSILRG
ncbi:MAG: alpha/beta hydrolase [Candidatus Aminicenantes bacterium]|jgi:pimeloyl-ACP methyl ester carboxylesterase